ncbi:MAG: GNAT family N-acetyltransferase [Actinomycetota bacterium]|nr:GNAT family N-acetyltransferase [Actinomycetota bacterium]
MATRETRDRDVLHDDAAGRYELWLDDELVGVADYVDRDGALAFVHTEILPGRRNEGLAARLVRAALEDVVASGRRFVPVCPYVVAYVGRHPEIAGPRPSASSPEASA